MTDWLDEARERYGTADLGAQQPRTQAITPQPTSLFESGLIEKLERLHVTVDVRSIAFRIARRNRTHPYTNPSAALTAAVRDAWRRRTDQRSGSYVTETDRLGLLEAEAEARVLNALWDFSDAEQLRSFVRTFGGCSQ